MKLTKLSAITLFIGDVERSREFYTRVFGLTPLFQDDSSVAFGFDDAVINLLVREAAPDLISPAAVAMPGSSSGFQMTVEVDDVDAACHQLAGAGVPLLNGPLDRPWGVRTATFVDPDGHIWELAAKIPD